MTYYISAGVSCGESSYYLLSYDGRQERSLGYRKLSIIRSRVVHKRIYLSGIGTNKSNTLSIIPPRGIFYYLKMKNLLFKPILLIRYFSTSIKAKPLNLMDPYFLTGFSDAESSFSVSIRSKSNSKGEVK